MHPQDQLVHCRRCDRDVPVFRADGPCAACRAWLRGQEAQLSAWLTLRVDLDAHDAAASSTPRPTTTES